MSEEEELQDTLAMPAICPICRQHILKERLVKACLKRACAGLFRLSRVPGANG